MKVWQTNMYQGLSSRIGGLSLTACLVAHYIVYLPTCIANCYHLNCINYLSLFLVLCNPSSNENRHGDIENFEYVYIPFQIAHIWAFS